MWLFHPARIQKKTKSKSAQEVLDRLKEFLDGNMDQPVQVLCGFWEDQQNAISYQEIREAIKNGSLSSETIKDWQHDYSVLVREKMTGIWQDAMKQGPAGQPIFDGKEFTLNMQTPGIYSWISQRGAEFVTACAQEQKDAISALLVKKMVDEHTVDELARMIRPCIGLTEGQAKAVTKFYDNMVKTLTEAHPKMSKDRIRERALDAQLKYAEREHRARALLIAQTESAFAFNRGADEGIRQAQQQGLVGVVLKKWSTSGDDRVCPVCEALNGVTIGIDGGYDDELKRFVKEGRLRQVQISSAFRVADSMVPPAHPRCACAVEYVETSPPDVKNNGNSGENPLPQSGASDTMDIGTDYSQRLENLEDTIATEYRRLNEINDRYYMSSSDFATKEEKTEWRQWRKTVDIGEVQTQLAEKGMERRNFALDQVKAVNPNYSTGDYEWTNNCQRCVPTWEMRMRGHDAEVLPKETGPDDELWKNWRNIFDGAVWEKCAGTGNFGSAYEECRKHLEDWGDGARAEVYIQWYAGEAHVFAGQNIGGSIHFYDPQTGKGSVSDYFSRGFNVEICRIDQLAPNEKWIKECCKEVLK